MSQDKAQARASHWSKTRALTIFVLIVWFVFSFVVHWYAKELNQIDFMGFPLGYYLAVQGSLAIFVILIFFQNFVQDIIDNNAGLDNES